MEPRATIAKLVGICNIHRRGHMQNDSQQVARHPTPIWKAVAEAVALGLGTNSLDDKAKALIKKATK